MRCQAVPPASIIGAPTAAVQLVSRTATLSNWKVVGSATYADAGKYTVAVTVTDVHGSAVETNKTGFSVADAALTDTTQAHTVAATEGRATGNVVLATFSDSNPSAPPSDYAAAVNWVGKVLGTPVATVQLVSRTATISTWKVIGNATFAEKGAFTVTVRVTDVDGKALSSSKTKFSVADAALADTTPATTLAAAHGVSSGNVVLAKFTDANPSASLSDFTAHINWGGTIVGTPTFSVQFVSSSANGSTWALVGSVKYANPGTFAITVTIADVDGSTLQSKKTKFKVT
jgi:hypothetical protein